MVNPGRSVRPSRPPTKPNWKPKIDDPLRQRKWHSRVFTGCTTCRRRHVKCDERTPVCSDCERLALDCNYDRDFVFRAVTVAGPPGANVLVSLSDETLEASDKAPPSPDLREDSESLSTSASGSVVGGSGSGSGNAGKDDGDVDEDADSQALVAGGPIEQTRSQRITIIDAPRGSATNYNPPWFDLHHNFRFNAPAGHWGASMPKQVDSADELYTRHFLNTVSTYLIVYDTAANSNPYRLLPSLMTTSGLLEEVMKALGAMHIAAMPNTRNRRSHHDAAMNAYGNVVLRLRNVVGSRHSQPTLEVLATTLLLCMFEKMSGHDSSWKIHLAGAGHVLQSMYSPRISLPANSDSDGRSRGGSFSGSSSTSSDSSVNARGAVSVADNLPLRRFLVSLMAYLDVAAACATGAGTVVAGDYWETLGGGWEYNLGAPSFAGAAKLPGERVMSQIRHSWSRMMSIQTNISEFVKLDRQGLDKSQRDLYYHNLNDRMRNWQESVPDIYVQLSQLDRMPPDISSHEYEALTAASCVQAYALACGVHLDRVMKRRVGNAAQDTDVASAVSRILILVFNFQQGINQLAAVWPVLTAGIATTDPTQQNDIRRHLHGMQGFAFQVRYLAAHALCW